MRLKICCRTSTLQGQSIVAGAWDFSRARTQSKTLSSKQIFRWRQDVLISEMRLVSSADYERQSGGLTRCFLRRRENRGSGGRAVFLGLTSRCAPGRKEGGEKEPFSGLCTVLQFYDGGVSIPPWSVGRGRFGD